MKSLIALILFSVLALAESKDACKAFRQEYDALSQLRDSTQKERDRLHLGFRRVLNDEITQTADGVKTGEAGEDNNKATRVYYRLRKVKAKLARLEEGLKKLSNDKCSACGQTEIASGRIRLDCGRCATQKGCTKEKS